MKKIFKLMLMLFAVASITCCMTACGDDDDPITETGGNSNSIDPSEIFPKGLLTKIGDLVITRDNTGKVTSMRDEYDNETYTFNYSPSNTDYDVSVTSPYETTYLQLNEKGFITYCKTLSHDDNTYYSDAWFTYNSNDQLIQAKYETDDMYNNYVEYLCEITYSDGNITKVVNTTNNKYKKEVDIEYFTYGTDENKSGIMLLDDIYDIDVENLEYLYFAGMFGKGTKNLVTGSHGVSSYNNEEYSVTYTWTLDNNEMPTKMVERSSFDYVETYNFTWKLN